MLLSAALMLLILPLQWILAAGAAALWHELCHIIAVRLCGGTFHRVNIGDGGIVMECKPMSLEKEVLCFLAGPLGSLLLLTLATCFPKIALCGFVHGLYNLIPVYPLDGGRALQAAAFVFLPRERAETFCVGTAYVAVIAVVCLAAVGVFVWKLGVLPVLLAAILLFRINREKLLANFRDRGYNRPTIVKR